MNYQAVKEAIHPSKALAAITTQAQMEPKSAQALVDAFMPLFLRTEEAVADGLMVTVTDAADIEGMKRARAKRMALREIRLEAEQNRKTFKEEALRTGQAIDKIAGLIKDKIEPVEKRLKEQEEYAERIEAERKAKLAYERSTKLVALRHDPSNYPLGEMTDEAFVNVLEGATLAHEKRLADAERLKAEQVAAEKARQEELAKARAENERMRLEQAQKDEAARKDREAAEAVARTERLARERAENELKAKQAAEQKKADDEAAAARKAAAAPDQEKFYALARTIRGIQIPAFSTDAADELGLTIRTWIGKLADRIEKDANAL